MTGFDIVDRYDIVIALLMGVAMDAALILGAPLWALALILFTGCVIVFIRHFDEIMWS
ncbi:MAG: hypothetical protein ABSH36_18460 [Solirubrobacteraceae bacterium]